MRTSKGYLFPVCYSRGVRHHQLPLAEIQRQVREGKLYSRKGKVSDVLQSKSVGMRNLKVC